MHFLNTGTNDELVDIGTAKPLKFAAGVSSHVDQFDWLGEKLQDGRAVSLVEIMTNNRVRPITEAEAADLEAKAKKPTK